MTDEDDDTQVQADTLLIVYQRGFADGKAAAQRKPLTDEQVAFYCQNSSDSFDFARAIEAAHGIKEGT
jgi:hypothetical protein